MNTTSPDYNGTVMESDYLTAKITKIDPNGLMTVKFSDDLIIPDNYTMFNNSIMNLSLIFDENFN
jgi:hypothetical protein